MDQDTNKFVWRRLGLVNARHIVSNFKLQRKVDMFRQTHRSTVVVKCESFQVANQYRRGSRQTKSFGYGLFLLACAAHDHVVMIEQFRLGELAQSIAQSIHVIHTYVEAEIHVPISGQA